MVLFWWNFANFDLIFTVSNVIAIYLLRFAGMSMLFIVLNNALVHKIGRLSLYLIIFMKDVIDHVCTTCRKCMHLWTSLSDYLFKRNMIFQLLTTSNQGVLFSRVYTYSYLDLLSFWIEFNKWKSIQVFWIHIWFEADF